MVIVEWGVAARLTTGDIYRGDNITVFKLRSGRIAECHDYCNPTAFAVGVAALEKPE